MKIGRNDPCPCGSGKKYKLCCLQKDQQLRAQENERWNTVAPSALPTEGEAAPPGGSWPFPQPPTAAGPVATASPPPPEPSPEEDALYRHWDAFEAADFAGRFRLFDDSLDDPSLMDEENIFSMFDQLVVESRARRTGPPPRFGKVNAEAPARCFPRPG